MREAASDPVWTAIREEARQDAGREPVLADFLKRMVLRHKSLEESLTCVLSRMLASSDAPARTLAGVMKEALRSDPHIGQAARADLRATRDRDPACASYSCTLLYAKGFQALQCHRVAHWLYGHHRQTLARFIQGRVTAALSVDIHPAARIGQGILLDHATGLVIGETAVIGDNVSLLHEVTLGGTGKAHGDRHPKIRDGVLIGAGAKLLGNIIVGEGAKVGAGSVVLKNVAAHHTVAGVPARTVGRPGSASPALDMDQSLPSRSGA